MKLVIFGATGGTGQQLVKQGLAAGHEVTAVVRNPVAIGIQHERLQVIQGDVLQPATLEQPLTGKDVVISSIGVHSRGPTVVYSQGVANILSAMKSVGVRRFICVSANGLDPGPLLQQWFAKPLLWRVFKYGYADMVLMENAVKASDLDWTIVRPPMLTNGERTGRYKTAVNKHLMSGWTLSRADLADYILTQLNNRASYCSLIEIAH